MLLKDIRASLASVFRHPDPSGITVREVRVLLIRNRRDYGPLLEDRWFVSLPITEFE